MKDTKVLLKTKKKQQYDSERNKNLEFEKQELVEYRRKI